MFDSIAQFFDGFQENFQIVIDNQVLIDDKITFLMKLSTAACVVIGILFLMTIAMFIRQSQTMGMIKKLIIDNRQLKEQLIAKEVVKNGNIDQ